MSGVGFFLLIDAREAMKFCKISITFVKRTSHHSHHRERPELL